MNSFGREFRPREQLSDTVADHYDSAFVDSLLASG